MTAYTEVLFEVMPGNAGNLGIIILNRPEVLNSLNQPMVHAIHKQLQHWVDDTSIKAVVIKAAEGRAFCAGGDLRSTHERGHSQDSTLANFFHDEYQLNRFIFHYPKPYIALWDGITMGGGVGISIHGSHRIATDRLLFAMPETGIGFFPDVGGTYFLPRLPGKIGLYVGLVGPRISSDECVALGIANEKIPREAIPDVLAALANEKFSADARESVTNIIRQFRVSLTPSFILEHQSALDACFSKHTMEEIHHALEHSSELVCKEAAAFLAKKSPTSLKVTLEALRQGAKLDFDACMQQEFRLSTHFLQGHDFFEGIRAVIIDKDQKPLWKPSTLDKVTQNQVESYFSPLTKELA